MTVADGFVHAGPVGAGHYAKMVHNGIEYGLMMAYAEGYELLAAEPLITDTQAVIQAWTNGTVVRSWLQQLLAKALKEDPNFADISDYTEDSGEGRWTVEEAIHHRVPDAGHRGIAVRPVRFAAGAVTDDEGGVGVAQPVRWSCGQTGSAVRLTHVRPSSGAARFPILG